jgi:HPt (histidine-containing phosphotransfer) domain-containing protein
MAANQVLDMQIVDELLSLTDDGDPELLLDLINLFLGDGPAKIQSVLHGIASQDLDQIERAAHSLKGSAGNLGARMLQNTCELLQLAARGSRLGEARQLAPALESHFREARSALEALRNRYAP